MQLILSRDFSESRLAGLWAARTGAANDDGLAGALDAQAGAATIVRDIANDLLQRSPRGPRALRTVDAIARTALIDPR